jgi:protein-tyrosine phosphatase
MVAELLRAPARLLHPLRRRAARAALRARMPRTIVVVCHGNICRSPVAAGLLQQALGPAGIRVESAGFMGPNRRCPRDAVMTAARRGVDLTQHRSRLLVPDLVKAADLIVVMEPEQQRQVVERFGRLSRDVIVLGDLDPVSIETRTIRDPIEQGPDVFEASYARIERCVAALVRILMSPRR